MPLITLLTDFGTVDGYVAEMKGVLCSAAPEAVILDLSHDIPPQDVESARLAVARYWQRFPAGTVHLVVVDPTVGSPRAALATFSEGRFLVGPPRRAGLTGACRPAPPPHSPAATCLGPRPRPWRAGRRSSR